VVGVEAVVADVVSAVLGAGGGGVAGASAVLGVATDVVVLVVVVATVGVVSGSGLLIGCLLAALADLVLSPCNGLSQS
jgi:hypothetical protein